MSKQASNPFFDADFSKFADLANFADPAKFMDMSKFAADFKLPGLDVAALMAAQRKNAEAITTANQRAFEGIQAVARRQSEIVRQSMQETSGMLNEILASASPEEKLAKQAELTKATMEKTIANLRELSEMCAKSHYEAIEVLSNRLGESLEEIRGLIKPAANGKAAK